MFRLIFVAQLPRVALRQSTRRIPLLSSIKNKYIGKNLFIRGYAEHNINSTFGNEIPKEVANLTLNDYHNAADEYLENLVTGLEELSEDNPNELPDVELNHGVMTLEITGLGPYVINKQPPNKQIWIASPVSGPNRFDLYKGQWISLRNGLNLTNLLTAELQQAIPGASLGDI
ncbi:similar to Saccharomyces cerevisiae YDL120W YFH1 Mitochondrial matrix iron chaperone [Maudiozyma barnettii]|uniref:ferroxidase n=1 Tax=Maudiozyma barnettii TaxID=61262 RepID=A0A8H2VJW9_9SACH|nr:ferroxidase [Kazachstania barnettii]CAB4257059.1 similar to Saccharomyces cerevisiae YDL120W YFH1 Mitochondrial matrix iron chaperone [Kazachstania barnettii]CAD1779430.1 similar to Saccharomyces cerevisiae YDL120W YFH1 Mitochondrial matrix iron chaperone [Kazachstania barnettii]